MGQISENGMYTHGERSTGGASSRSRQARACSSFPALSWRDGTITVGSAVRTRLFAAGASKNLLPFLSPDQENMTGDVMMQDYTAKSEFEIKYSERRL